MKIWIAALGLAICAEATSSRGLIGGGVGELPSAYAAGIEQKKNAWYATEPIALPGTSLEAESHIYSVALNNAGLGLVGGFNTTTEAQAYAAILHAKKNKWSATVVSLPNTGTISTIFSVAVNQAKIGLLGGFYFINPDTFAYAAIISQTQGAWSAQSISLPDTGTSSKINSVSLNSQSFGLVGGYIGLQGYTAILSKNVDSWTATSVSLPGSSTTIVSVSLNTDGVGLVAGKAGVNGYAAIVSQNNGGWSATQVDIVGQSSIVSAALNDQGIGLIGGVYDTPVPTGYVAVVQQNGGVWSASMPIALPGVSDTVQFFIDTVALNKANIGLVGGYFANEMGTVQYAYAAFVKNNNHVWTATQIPLPNLGDNSFVTSVAIDAAGVGLIGGFYEDSASYGYLALVAPNGSVTEISLHGLSALALHDAIDSVALDDLPPSSTGGPYASVAYTLLAAEAALEMRFTSQYVPINPQSTEVASNDPKNRWAKSSSSCTQKNCLWVAPFGNYVKIQSQDNIPTYTNAIGGALLGYDRCIDSFLVGGALGYAFNGLDYSQGLGHGALQEEMISCYMAYQKDHVRLNSALWGGFYQFHNTRRTPVIPGFTVTSEAHIHGWILSPHLELASPWAMNQSGQYTVEPFLMFDWVNSWQAHYKESGSVGLNLEMNSLYASLLQSEVGLRFYERFQYDWGQFLLQEKISYVNQAPFHFHNVTTLFAGGGSTFPVASGSTQVQNLGAFELYASFLPIKNYPYGGLKLQTLLGPDYQSYFISIDLGQKF